MMISIRKPAVAGQFYPAQKKILSRQIKNFLRQASWQKEKGRLKILIVPHAGLNYSGSVAGAGFRQLQNQDYTSVLLMGVSHHVYFPGAAIDDHNFWATPLGRVEVDQPWARKIVAGIKGVAFSSAAHVQEHSLEVELLFLQLVLPNFTFVPLLLGEIEESFSEELSVFFARNLNEKTLVVISTDLSHYPSYDQAGEIDKKTISSITTGNPENFSKTIAQQMVQGYPNLATCICGEKAVKAGLKLAKKLGQGSWKLIKYANSGDVLVDGIASQTQVVGYAALGWYQTK